MSGPASEFSVVDEMPDSVKALADRPAPARLRRERASAAPAASGPPAGAKKAALPAQLQPQLATLVDAPPKDTDNWLYEIKFDGYRMLTRAEGGAVRLITRNGNDWTRKLPQLAKALEAMDLPDGWYDGEIIVPGDRVPADFQALQGAFDASRTADIVYYLFDLPYCAGYDLREVPLLERRSVLQRIARAKAARQGPLQRQRSTASRKTCSPRLAAWAWRAWSASARIRAYVPRRSSELDQAQVRPAPGVRHRRLHRPEGFTHRPGLAAAGRARRGRATALCGQRGHGLRASRRCASCAPS